MILGLFILVVVTFSVSAEEPWSISERSPVTYDVWPEKRQRLRSPAGLSAHLFSFFQKYISPLDGSTCYYRPTCSRYATRAVQRYGVIQGTIMGFDRLTRCHSGQSEPRFDPAIHY